MEEKVFYEALYAYNARGDSQLSLVPGDVVEAAKSTKVDEGWLRGTNHRTGDTGFFPASFVRPRDSREAGNDSGYCELNASPGPPQLSSRRRHHLVDVYLVTPVLCKHCDDYLWGEASVGQKCEECHSFFHHVCVQFSIRYHCTQPKDSLPITYSKPVIRPW